MEHNERSELLQLLARAYADGRFGADDLLPALIDVLKDDEEQAPAAIELYNALKDRSEVSFRKLLDQVRRQQLTHCFLAHGSLLSDSTSGFGNDPNLAHLPSDISTGWKDEEDIVRQLSELVRLLIDYDHIFTHAADGPDLTECFSELLQQQLDEYQKHPDRPQILTNETSPELTELCSRYREAGESEERQQYLDLLLRFPSDAVAEKLIGFCSNPDDQWRACQILSLRFGKANLTDWPGWKMWLQEQVKARQERYRKMDELRMRYHLQLERISQAEDADQLPAPIKPQTPVELESFLRRHKDHLTPEQVSYLCDRNRPKAEPTSGKAIELHVPQKPQSAPKTPMHTLLTETLRPFIMQNWYMVAGLCMVLVGAGLLAYYTWNRHWIFRYTVMPLIMAAITFGFGHLAEWLERQSGKLKSTVSILRGGVLALVPINFMALCLFAVDRSLLDQSTGSRLAISGIMAVSYLLLYGAGQKRWIGKELGAPYLSTFSTMLFLNILIVVGSFLLIFNTSSATLWLTILFYAGFAAMIANLVKTASTVGDNSQQLMWFVGAASVVCFGEIFVGLCFFLRYYPDPAHFSFMPILLGTTILYLSGRSGKDRSQELSFLAYALLGLGILMSLGSPYMRTATLITAGIIWLYFARHRIHAGYCFAGLTMITLGMAGIYTWPGFPSAASWNSAGWLGLGIVAILSAIAHAYRRFGTERQVTVARQFRAAIIILSAVVAVLQQWMLRANSVPVWTGAVLAICALVMFLYAQSTRRTQPIYSAAALAILALPYLGCLDMTTPHLTGNTMVFGLSALGAAWVAWNHFRPNVLLLKTRSNVLFGLGVLAVVAMLLRITLEGSLESSDLWYRFQDESGPILMAAILVFATWYSRSLIPAGMAAIILAVLLPELKAQYKETAEMLGYGSGLGSAAAALILCVICYPLSRWQKLKNLLELDRVNDQTSFPLQRLDATLFTLPLAGTAFFLAAKVSIWLFPQSLLRTAEPSMFDLSALLQSAISMKSCAALFVAGTAWMGLAIYFRRRRFAVALGQCSWILLALGFFWSELLVEQPMFQRPVFFAMLTILGIFWVAIRLVHRFDWLQSLIITPYHELIRFGSVAGGLVLLFLGGLYVGLQTIFLPLGVVLVLLGWFSLQENSRIHGGMLFSLLLSSILSAIGGVDRPFDQSASSDLQLYATIGYLILWHLPAYLAEFRPAMKGRLLGLIAPGRWITLVITGFLYVMWLLSMPIGGNSSFVAGQLFLFGILLLLVMRQNRSLTIGTLFCIFLYGSLSSSAFGNSFDVYEPWAFGLFVVTCVLLLQAARTATPLWKKITGIDVDIRPGRSKALLILGMLAASLVTLVHTASFVMGEELQQLPGTYLAAAALIVIYWQWPNRFFLVLSLVFEFLGNLHFVRWIDGEALGKMGWHSGNGLLWGHWVCLALALFLLQQFIKSAAIRWFARRPTQSLRDLPADWYAHNLISFIERFRNEQTKALPWLTAVSAAAAYAAMLILALTYCTNPGINQQPTAGYLVAIVTASAVVIRCRGRERHNILSNIALLVGVWATVFLVPAMRMPSLSMFGLLMGPIVLCILSEFRRKRFAVYTAGIAALVSVLNLVHRFHYMVAHPDMEWTWHFDSGIRHAVCAIILGLVMVRQHKYRQPLAWPAFIGMGVMIVAGWQLACSVIWHDQSPLTHALYAAGIAIVMGHIALSVLRADGPVERLFQRFAGISAGEWSGLCRAWQWLVIVLVHAILIPGCLDSQVDPRLVAPLLGLSATLLVHHFFLTGSITTIGVAALECLLGLHMDFFIVSYLDQQQVIWVILGCWAILLGAGTKRLPMHILCAMSKGFGLLALLHVMLVLGPSSIPGLVVAAGAAVLLVLTRRNRAEDDDALSLPILLLPMWLGYFGCMDLELGIVIRYLHLRPLIGAAAGLTMSAAACLMLRGTPEFGMIKTLGIGSLLAKIKHEGELLSSKLLIVMLGISALCVQAILSAGQLGNLDWTLVLTAICLIGTYLWQQCGAKLATPLTTTLAGANLFGAWLTVRHIIFHLVGWDYSYDVWGALLVAFLLTGLRGLMSDRPAHERVPITWSICLLAPASLGWIIYRELGVDLALVVFGLHGLLFTFMGRDRSDSPFNAASVLSFVGFFLTLSARFEFNVIHAYVIPIGVGILILLHLFGQEMHADAKNRIRLVTLLAMLGSTGWYAIIGGAYSLTFNLTMLGLCLAVMGLGSFLHVRVYVLLGFTGLLVDLASLLYKGLRELEKAYQMAAIGLLLLCLGGFVVLAAVWYKTNSERIEAWINQWRKQIRAWE